MHKCALEHRYENRWSYINKNVLFTMHARAHRPTHGGVWTATFCAAILHKLVCQDLEMCCAGPYINLSWQTLDLILKLLLLNFNGRHWHQAPFFSRKPEHTRCLCILWPNGDLSLSFNKFLRVFSIKHWFQHLISAPKTTTTDNQLFLFIFITNTV